MKHASRYIYIALAALWQTACSDTANTLFTPSEQPIHEMEIGFSVSETEWEGQTVSMTRSGETLEALEANGFGMFCEVLAMTNREVKWHKETGTWDYDTKILWPKRVVDDLMANPSEIFAYAPFTDSDAKTENGGKPQITFDDLENNPYNPNIKYTCNQENPTDLLWASPKISPDGIIHLEFKHALAKLSFGTITNNYGHSITLESVTISGASTADGKLYTSGTLYIGEDLYTDEALSLASGTWSDLTNPISPIDPIKPIDPNEEDKAPLEIKNGETASFGIETKMLIPQKIEVEIVVKVPEAPNGSETNKTIKKNVTLKQGKNTEINLTVGQNHEVVIEDNTKDETK